VSQQFWWLLLSLFLTETTRDEVSCEWGVTNALGFSLSQLEARWRASSHGSATDAPARNLLPCLVLMVLALNVRVLGMMDFAQWRRNHERQVK
jgi:hypothetical protein